jgi:hypothetical protein
MIGVIVVLVVCITIGIMSILNIHKNNKRIKELEQRLTDYYKEREQRLEKLNEINTDIKKDIKVLKRINKSKGLIKRGSEWPE